jgi:hypothetical protein
MSPDTGLKAMDSPARSLPSEAQKRLIGSVAQQPKAGFFKRIFSRGGVKSIISEKRSKCCVVSVLVLVDKSIPLDGMVMDIGTIGATFRPASSYILDRGRSEVLLRFAERELRGKITSVTPRGYDITFQNPMPASAVSDVVLAFGLDDNSDALQMPISRRLS